MKILSARADLDNLIYCSDDARDIYSIRAPVFYSVLEWP